MDINVARDRLARGLAKIDERLPEWEKRERYYRGNLSEAELPFAPQGVNSEYMALRLQAPVPLIHLIMDTPVQRLRPEGFRTGRNDEADQVTWNEIWQPNNLDSRQRIVYSQMVVHGRGLMSVWRNDRDRKSPLIRPENCKRVHVEPDPEDPFSAGWAVKTFTIEDRAPSALILPDSMGTGTRQVGVVYDRYDWVRFEKGGAGSYGDWERTAEGVHNLGEVPFVTFDNQQDADGQPRPGVDCALMQAQDAINTIRFQTLLAMQFSAFRQRVISGFDPVVRDDDGKIVHQRTPEGELRLDQNGLPIPVVTSFGRVGVDRALVFPGVDTKVFDMPESNLANYITVYKEFLTSICAVGQVPPDYILSDMVNLSGDAIEGANTTLKSLVSDMKTWTGESLEQVMRLANRARGEEAPDLASEVVWANEEARSFSQVIDGITKLVSSGFPKKAAFEMIPGATPPQVTRWMRMAGQENAAARRAITAASPETPATGTVVPSGPTALQDGMTPPDLTD